MRVVAIETSGAVGGVAACEDDRVLAEFFLRRSMAHGRELIPTLGHLLSDVGWQPWTVELLAVSIGPGSYTGLRLSVTCAKLFSFVTGCECVGVCTMDAIAENAPATTQDVCVLLDAKWGQVYGASYRRQGSGTSIPRFGRRWGPAVGEPGAFAHEIPEKACVVGDAIPAYRAFFSGRRRRFGAQRRWLPHPGVVGVLGFRKYVWQGADSVDTLSPLYLRPSAAEQKGMASGE